MNSYDLRIMEVNQHIGTLYLSKINGNILYKMAKSDILKIYSNSDYEGIQRELDLRRVEQIKKYLKTEFSSFPNSIILNIDSEKIISAEGDILKVVMSSDTFSIIDGQHRLAGFEDGDVEDFEVPISIFVDLDISDQALLFSTINSEQKKVDPSQKMSLEKYSKVNTPKKVVTDLAYALNMDEESPWFRRIKLTGRKDVLSENGIIALKTFATPIIDYIYNDADNYVIRDWLNKGKSPESMKNYNKERYILWDFYVNERMDAVYKILFNYFCAISKLLPDDWGNSESVLTKTTGYNALMKLFKDLFKICIEQKDFSEAFMMDRLRGLSKFSGQITADNYGGSGYSSSTKLYVELKCAVNI